MKAFDTFDTSLRLNLLTLFTAGLVFWSSMGLLLPTLPLYIQDLGASKQQIGIVIGGFAIGLLLFRPMLGRLADQHGRKLLLLIGTIIAAIAPLGYLAFTSIPLLMLVRVFHGISMAAFTTGYSALVADLAPLKQRGEIISYMSLAAPIGLAFGPALGGYLQATTGYGVLFLLATEIAFIGVLASIQVINPPVQRRSSVPSKKTNFWQILISPRMRVPAIVMLLAGLALGSVHTFLPLFIQETGVDLNAGLFFTVSAIASFTLRIFVGRASDRFGRGLFITFGILAYTLTTLLLWQARSSSIFLLAGITEGLGGGTLISMITTLMADRSLPEERGQIFALCIAGFDFGLAIAAPIFGFVAEKAGYPNMFAGTACLTFLGLMIFLTQSNKNVSSSLRFALGRGEDSYSLNKL
ncbi:MFS transporter [Nostoc sp. CENA67]|uniref:MFS transporter n=1 Tax=Amazonocrinis nigriterrae CENA67 TaxID=2794033 RepID=A0A8J7LBC6_9NOST|nr:MFS transporter [Amazonocrinis nigriterrae]MBH8565171.1 MFS transporter [Amazonocrinis nigriterrae CENA67]